MVKKEDQSLAVPSAAFSLSTTSVAIERRSVDDPLLGYDFIYLSYLVLLLVVPVVARPSTYD